MQNCVAGGWVWGMLGWNEWMKRIFRVSLRLESCSQKVLEKQCLFRGLVHFRLVFFVRSRDCTTFTLHVLADFYTEMVTTHRTKINDHSCFHNRWPNSKTKLKWKHIWEHGGPWCFGALCSLCILRIGTIGSDYVHGKKGNGWYKYTACIYILECLFYCTKGYFIWQLKAVYKQNIYFYGQTFFCCWYSLN